MIREVKESEKKAFDQLAPHPLQSWAWGEFRASSRVEVIRLGQFVNHQLKNGFQITFHRLPALPFTIGYCPKSNLPSPQVLQEIQKQALKRKALMVKFEPHQLASESQPKIDSLQKEFNLVKGRPLFTKFTFWLDLTKSEAELLSQMKSKTRYNTRLAARKGVQVVEDSTPQGFKQYWQLTKETTARQSFYAHDFSYHQKMWRILGQKNHLAHLLKAVYQGQTLATWMIFILNDLAYYPYGASSNQHRQVMASNLIMWEAIKFAKAKKCRLFDMWGSTGPNPQPNDPWFGFHHFKQGYGAQLVEFVGTYDFVINPLLYWPYRLGESLRWTILRLLKK